MPVPSLISDLSTVAGSNSPAGTDNPSQGDDYLRALSSFIAQLRDLTNGTSGNVVTINLTVSGNTILGDAAGDTLTINAGTVSMPNSSLITGVPVFSGAEFGNSNLSNAQALDWVFRGNFTPTAVGQTTAGAATYIVQTGRYIRLGRRVFFDIDIGWSAHTGTGILQINGLPHASGLTLETIKATPDLTGLSFDAWCMRMTTGSTSFTLSGRNQNTGANGLRSIASSDRWRINGSYEAQ